jgi:hypothetical protein
MRKILTVTVPFADYQRGDRIEGEAMHGLQASHPGHVVATMTNEPLAEGEGDPKPDKPAGHPEPKPDAPKAAK